MRSDEAPSYQTRSLNSTASITGTPLWTASRACRAPLRAVFLAVNPNHPTRATAIHEHQHQAGATAAPRKTPALGAGSLDLFTGSKAVGNRKSGLPRLCQLFRIRKRLHPLRSTAPRMAMRWRKHQFMPFRPTVPEHLLRLRFQQGELQLLKGGGRRHLYLRAYPPEEGQWVVWDRHSLPMLRTRIWRRGEVSALARRVHWAD
jgi:hypothetical protein